MEENNLEARNGNVQDVPVDIELPSYEEPSKAPIILGAIAGIIFFAVLIVGVLILKTLLTGPINPRNELENRLMTAKAMVQKNSADVNARIELGSAYLDWGRYSEAESELKAGLQLAPNSGDAHYLLALVYEGQKNKNSAIEELCAAIKCNPGMDIASYRLGEIYRDTGKNKEAIEAYKKVLKINPSSADALYQLGLIYEKENRKEDAIKAFRQSLKYIPNYPEVVGALKRVQGK